MYLNLDWHKLHNMCLILIVMYNSRYAGAMARGKLNDFDTFVLLEH